MCTEKDKKRITVLRNWLNEWNYNYFVLNKNDVSEVARDKLKRELEDLEKKYPKLVTPDSPTQRVGSIVSSDFAKIKHITQKESLSDIFTFEELDEWEIRIKKILPEIEFDYICELKIDGLNISIIYKDGIFEQAITRGNGIEGEDVTHTIKTIESIPLKLRKKLNLMEVSGEVYMSKKSFKKLNEKENFKNPRNAAAGTVRQLNPKIASERNLDMFFYSMDKKSVNLNKIKTQNDLLDFFNDIGLKVNKNYKHCKNISKVKEYIKLWERKRDVLPYEIDGVVVKVNNILYQKNLGSTAKAPRYAIAYKFPAEQSTTKILDIKLQIGRTGAITPVAIMKPTLLDGSMVSRATLHNDEEIKRKDIRIGDTIIIQKAGDIIPAIVKVIKELRTGDEIEFMMPILCPACEAKLIKPENESIYRCPNTDCYAKNKELLEHFISKKGFNIKGMGPSVINQLIENNLIEDPADIFNLNKGDLLQLDLFQEKRADNIIKSINESKIIDLNRFIYSLGIRYIGDETTQIISKIIKLDKETITIQKEKTSNQLNLFYEEEKEIKTLEVSTITNFLLSITSLSLEDLEAIDGIGKKVAESLYLWFRTDKNRRLLSKLEDNEIKLVYKENDIKNERFKGLSFCITGTLSKYSRDQIKKEINLRGGKIISKISKKTNFLIQGDNPGSKLKDAKDLGTKIITEDKITKLLDDTKNIDL